YKVHKYNTHLYPYIVPISWLIYDDILKKVTKIEDHVIKLPEGIQVPKVCSDIHGITTEKMLEKGENIVDVLKLFTKDLLDSNYIIAHNINFDKTIIQAEYIRNNKIDWIGRHRKEEYCTMANSKEICSIIKKTKNGHTNFYSKQHQIIYIIH
ncbi:MAG: hypothetical protein CXT73_04420, partial [Methanobacteriota archaeon]